MRHRTTTPASPGPGLALQIPWSHATPPHHLHQFSTRSLERLVERGGFEIVDVFYAGMAS
ncbi:MAG: hypothetical protein QNK04_16295 [Myxococcota bacterium]|nr:hypothetical protein [Myxococcota bacterium]